MSRVHAEPVALIGLFASIYHPVGTAIVVGTTYRPGQSLGVNGVWGNMGVAGAALMAGAMTDALGWRAAFVVPGLVSIATGVAYAVCLRNGIAQPTVVASAVASAARPRPERSARIRAYLVLGVAALLGGIIFNSITVAMPKVFDERLASLVDTTFGVGGRSLPPGTHWTYSRSAKPPVRSSKLRS